MTRKYTDLSYTEYMVADGHYDESRKPITTIVLHSSASTKQGLIDTFGGGSRMVSAHYGIDNQGNIMAFLEEYYTAYHAGDYDMNQKSIGIEHVDEGADKKIHSESQYTTSIKLVADICKYYNIPCDLDHIIPHSSVVATACPNGLDVNRIINGARELLGMPTETDNKDLIETLTKKINELSAERDRLNRVIESKDLTIADKDKVISTQSEQLINLRKDLDQAVESLKLETERSVKLDELRKKWYDLYTQLKENYEMVKTQLAQTQKKLTILQEKEPKIPRNMIERIQRALEVLLGLGV